jgi:hypothetical protein
MFGGIMGIMNVAYVFGLKKKLLNIGMITSQGYIIMFNVRECLMIHEQDHQVAIISNMMSF